MKAVSFIFFLCLVSGFIGSPIAFSQTSNFAFLVGAGDYPSDSGWQPLNASNDVALLKNSLLQHQFSEENILTITGDQASREGILNALEKAFLPMIKPQSRVVFFFSGHGQQVADNNGDEIDGYDEALVPIDSPVDFEAGKYEGENLIRDEEIGDLLREIRWRIGRKGHLFVLIDACHSGTGTRGLGITRGTDKVMATDAYQKVHHPGRVEASSLDAYGEEGEKGLASMVSFFSSSAQELSYEFSDEQKNSYGLMTYSFCKGLSSLDQGASYQGLLERVRMEVSAVTSRQTPRSEGELDQPVLGGATIDRPLHFTTRAWMDERLVVLDAGQVHGLNPGCEVVFYPIDTKDTSQVTPIASGVVDYTKALDSDVLLDRPVSKKEMMGAWAFVKKINYGSLNLRLKVSVESKGMKAQLKSFLGEKDYIEFVGKDFQFILLEEGDSLLLVSKQEKMIWERQVAEELSDKDLWSLQKAITKHLRASFLRKLIVEDDRFVASIELQVKKGEQFVPTSQTKFKIGQEAQLRIVNNGNYGVYLSVIDIMPNDEITLVIPWDKPADEYYLPPGKTFVFDTILEILPPKGRDVLKVIATPEPLNLEKVLKAQGAMSRNQSGITNPFEMLFGDTFLEENNTRGITTSMPMGVGYVGGIVIDIEE